MTSWLSDHIGKPEKQRTLYIISDQAAASSQPRCTRRTRTCSTGCGGPRLTARGLGAWSGVVLRGRLPVAGTRRWAARSSASVRKSAQQVGRRWLLDECLLPKGPECAQEEAVLITEEPRAVIPPGHGIFHGEAGEALRKSEVARELDAGLAPMQYRDPASARRAQFGILHPPRRLSRRLPALAHWSTGRSRRSSAWPSSERAPARKL